MVEASIFISLNYFSWLTDEQKLQGKLERYLEVSDLLSRVTYLGLEVRVKSKVQDFGSNLL